MGVELLTLHRQCRMVRILWSSHSWMSSGPSLPWKLCGRVRSKRFEGSRRRNRWHGGGKDGGGEVSNTLFKKIKMSTAPTYFSSDTSTESVYICVRACVCVCVCVCERMVRSLTRTQVSLGKAMVAFHVEEGEFALCSSFEEGSLLDLEVLVQLHVGDNSGPSNVVAAAVCLQRMPTHPHAMEQTCGENKGCEAKKEKGGTS